MIADLMGVQKPKGLIGIHTNMPGAVPAEIEKSIMMGKGCPGSLR